VVFSVDSDSSISVRVYKDGVKVSDDGEVSTVSLPAGWSLYNENSTYKKFTLGAAHDARYFNYEKGTLTGVARSMKGMMDNIRIYDFAMTEDQMQEYATTVHEQAVAALEAWNEKLDENADKIERCNKLLDEYKNIIDVVGKDYLNVDNELLQAISDTRA
jgi:hypothetical protein